MEGGLEDQINLLLHQNRNVDGRCYVPEAALNRLMTEDLLYSTLTQLRIERYHIPDLIKAVVDRARKVFAILLVIYKGEEIVTIFQHDSLQNASLDGRLPYSAETLKQLFPSPASELTRLKFFDMQYHFAIPHFTRSTLPRALAIDMVLPINSQKFRGQGSFGEVWDIELHPDSHMLSKSTNKVIPFLSGYMSCDVQLLICDVLVCSKDFTSNRQWSQQGVLSRTGESVVAKAPAAPQHCRTPLLLRISWPTPLHLPCGQPRRPLRVAGNGNAASALFARR